MRLMMTSRVRGEGEPAGGGGGAVFDSVGVKVIFIMTGTRVIGRRRERVKPEIRNRNS
jgi:hypothetical protein